MIALMEVSGSIGQVRKVPCGDTNCSGEVAISNDNAVPFEGCLCLPHVYPCSVCGLVHSPDGEHVFVINTGYGTYWIDGQVVEKPIEGKKKKH
jgi:hypothetical protein